MARRHSAEKREILPDPKFNSLVIEKFKQTGTNIKKDEKRNN